MGCRAARRPPPGSARRRSAARPPVSRASSHVGATVRASVSAVPCPALRRIARRCPSNPPLRHRGRRRRCRSSGAQKATLSAICGITSRSFGSRSLNESSRQISLSLAPPSAKAASSGSGWMLPLRVEGGGERPVPALVHQALLDVDDRRHLRHRPRPGVGVVVGRVRRWSRRRGRCRPSSTSAPPSSPRSAGPAAPGRPRSSRRTRGRRSSAPRRRSEPGRLGVLGHLGPAVDRRSGSARAAARDRRSRGR